MIRIHPSSLGKIMSQAKSKKDLLSVGAKTHCYDLAKEYVYCYRAEISSKYLDKGNRCEDDSIELYNSVYGSNYKKNTVREGNDYLTGECDIKIGNLIIDIKTSWSLAQFPATKERAHDKDYEWQGRAYMILYGCDHFTLAFCLVSTPEDLIKYESEDNKLLHYVDMIDPRLRVTTVDYKRDEEKDELIETKCKAAQEQVEQYIKDITADHS